MNARQKAKKYKRMYEELVNRSVNFKVEQYKIDTVRFERHYPTPVVTPESNEYLRHCITKDIAFSLAEGLDKYIDYHTWVCPHENMYYISGEIKVVEKEAVKNE